MNRTLLFCGTLGGLLIGTVLLGGGTSAWAQKFNFCMSQGESVIIAKNGPLAFRAECTMGTGESLLNVIGTTTTANTRSTPIDTQFKAPGGPGDLGEFFFFNNFNQSGLSGTCGNSIDNGAMLSEAGHFLGIDGDTLIGCFDVLGCDCSIAGEAKKFRRKIRNVP